MEQAATLPFGAECLRWLRKGKGDSTGLDEVEIGEVGAVLAGRIAKDFGDAPDYAKHGRIIGTLLWIWKTHGGDGEMTAYLTGRFGEHPDEVARFLDAFIGRAWGLESGLSHKSDFDKSDFESVAALIDPEIVITALKGTYGSLLDNVSFDKCWELKDDEQTACRFVAIHQKVQQEQAAKQEAEAAAGGSGAAVPSDSQGAGPDHAETQ